MLQNLDFAITWLLPEGDNLSSEWYTYVATYSAINNYSVTQLKRESV